MDTLQMIARSNHSSPSIAGKQRKRTPKQQQQQQRQREPPERQPSLGDGHGLREAEQGSVVLDDHRVDDAHVN